MNEKELDAKLREFEKHLQQEEAKELSRELNKIMSKLPKARK